MNRKNPILYGLGSANAKKIFKFLDKHKRARYSNLKEFVNRKEQPNEVYERNREVG